MYVFVFVFRVTTCKFSYFYVIFVGRREKIRRFGRERPVCAASHGSIPHGIGGSQLHPESGFAWCRMIRWRSYRRVAASPLRRPAALAPACASQAAASSQVRACSSTSKASAGRSLPLAEARSLCKRARNPQASSRVAIVAICRTVRSRQGSAGRSFAPAKARMSRPFASCGPNTTCVPFAAVTCTEPAPAGPKKDTYHDRTGTVVR